MTALTLMVMPTWYLLALVVPVVFAHRKSKPAGVSQDFTQFSAFGAWLTHRMTLPAIIILFGLNSVWPDVFGSFSQCRRAETKVKIFLELSMAWLLMYCWGALRHYLRAQSQGHHTIDCLDVRCRRMKSRVTVRKQGHPMASIRRSLELFQRQRLKLI